MNWSNDWGKPQQHQTGVVGLFDAGANIGLEPLPHKVTLTIPIENAWPKMVEAMQVGDLAVHEDMKVEDKRWQVTHLPTLTRFNAVPDGLYKKVDLIEWCKRVQANLTDDWNTLKQLTNGDYKSKLPDVIAAKDRICAMCQAMKVEQ